VFEWLRNRRKSEAVEAEPDVFALEGMPDDWDEWHQGGMQYPVDDEVGFIDAIGLGALNGMTEREREEFFSIYGPSKVRKQMRRRLKAREDARKRQDKS